MTSQRTKKTKAPNKTAPVEKVSEYPAFCPKCGCTERTGKEKVLTRQISGTLPNGQAYNYVQNYRAECKGCGQRLAYNRYCFDVSDHG